MKLKSFLSLTALDETESLNGSEATDETESLNGFEATDETEGLNRSEVSTACETFLSSCDEELTLVSTESFLFRIFTTSVQSSFFF